MNIHNKSAGKGSFSRVEWTLDWSLSVIYSLVGQGPWSHGGEEPQEKAYTCPRHFSPQ